MIASNLLNIIFICDLDIKIQNVEFANAKLRDKLVDLILNRLIVSLILFFNYLLAHYHFAHLFILPYFLMISSLILTLQH